MRTMLRKGLVVFVVLTLGLYFVVACGSDESTEETAEPTATAEVEEPAETTTSESLEDPQATTTTVEDTASGGEYAVISEVVGDDATEDITVWAPDAEGPWPVVFALGSPQGAARIDFTELATQLASHGVVFIASDWPRGEARDVMERADQSRGLPAGLLDSSECGYRYAREIAADYGGDLTQPVTMVGFDKGATGVLYLATDEATYGPDGTYAKCFAGAPRPEVVVTISGCCVQNGFPDELAAWGNSEAGFTLIVGSEAEIAQEELEAQEEYERDFTSCCGGRS